MDNRVQPIVEFADIGEFINQPVKTYSSGMFARLAFAVAINVEPDILIVDEALAVGDMKFQIKYMDKMKSMMENNGTTVLFVSHDINAIRRFCGRALWISHGSLVKEGLVNKICDIYSEFLNSGEIFDKSSNNTESIYKNFELPSFNFKKDIIAEIIDFKIIDSYGREIDSVEIGRAHV